jgi:enoyl-[acyl-carrier protein] reductase I
VCALLSDYMPATTGEVVHVDGGHHALGAELPEQSEEPGARRESEVSR